jgi:hypothetical protein
MHELLQCKKAIGGLRRYEHLLRICVYSLRDTTVSAEQTGGRPGRAAALIDIRYTGITCDCAVV